MPGCSMDKAKLAALLQDTDSDFAFEVVKACKAANALLKAQGVTWAQVLAEPLPEPETPRKAPERRPETPKGSSPKPWKFSEDEKSIWRERIQRLQNRGPSQFKTFFDSVAKQLDGFGSLSPKQQSAIMRFIAGV
jgi:hypothetical protein